MTHSIAYGAMIAADKRNIPRISVALAPLVLMSVYDAPELWIMQMLHRLSPRARLKISEIFRSSLLKLFGQLFNPIYRLRSELDLPRPKDIFEAAYSSLGTICLWSPSFAAKQPDSPPNTHIVGFPFRSRSHETLPPPKLEEFLECGEKPLVFTLGSFGWAAGGNFYQESIKVARQLGMRAVLLTGKGNDLGDLLDASPDIITCDFVDHAYLFPRAAVVIHHGGPGTLSEALRAGCPQLIVPISSDQPDSARRAAAMGVAKVLPIKQYRGKKLFENLSYLQSNELIQARAKAISKLVLEERGISDAAAIIHSVIQSRQTADLEVPSPTEARALEASS
jgi:UDP:flavonoid glycosyltransferase YjiC (YdhE family)